MRGLLCLLLLTACSAQQERPCSAVDTQADLGLVIGTTGIVVLTAAAVDPTSVRDSGGEHATRLSVEAAAATAALAGVVTIHAAVLDAQQCRETEDR